MRGQVDIADGRVRKVRGQVPQAVLDELADEARRSPKVRATLTLSVEGGRFRLSTRGGDEGFAQRCRNRLALHPPSRGGPLAPASLLVPMWVPVSLLVVAALVVVGVLRDGSGDAGWQPLDDMSEAEAEAFAGVMLEHELFAEQARALEPVFAELEAARLLEPIHGSRVQRFMRLMPAEVPLFLGPRALVVQTAARDDTRVGPAAWASRLQLSGLRDARVGTCAGDPCVLVGATELRLPSHALEGEPVYPCDQPAGLLALMRTLDAVGAALSPPRHVRFLVAEPEDQPTLGSALLLLSSDEEHALTRWSAMLTEGLGELPGTGLEELDATCPAPVE
ncbi:MAG: hypothetical protein R3B40_09265 [Polyangiales bacterium]|nr:hypothetical protein [Myxococcales bacterium]MCB9656205.1 hypothetical protein [Sandaracinaceae bacterium]